MGRPGSREPHRSLFGVASQSPAPFCSAPSSVPPRFPRRCLEKWRVPADCLSLRLPWPLRRCFRTCRNRRYRPPQSRFPMRLRFRLRLHPRSRRRPGWHRRLRLRRRRSRPARPTGQPAVGGTWLARSRVLRRKPRSRRLRLRATGSIRAWIAKAPRERWRRRPPKAAARVRSAGRKRRLCGAGSSTSGRRLPWGQPEEPW